MGVRIGAAADRSRRERLGALHLSEEFSRSERGRAEELVEGESQEGGRNERKKGGGGGVDGKCP